MGVPDSAPYVFSGGEIIGDLACQILSRIGDKAKKAYPPNTTLIVNCETDTVILENEWKEAITQVENAGIHKTFREVFLTAPVARHTATLWQHPRPSGNSCVGGVWGEKRKTQPD